MSSSVMPAARSAWMPPNAISPPSKWMPIDIPIGGNDVLDHPLPAGTAPVSSLPRHHLDIRVLGQNLVIAGIALDRRTGAWDPLDDRDLSLTAEQIAEVRQAGSGHVHGYRQ